MITFCPGWQKFEYELPSPWHQSTNITWCHHLWSTTLVLVPRCVKLCLQPDSLLISLWMRRDRGKLYQLCSCVVNQHKVTRGNSTPCSMGHKVCAQSKGVLELFATHKTIMVYCNCILYWLSCCLQCLYNSTSCSLVQCRALYMIGL